MTYQQHLSAKGIIFIDGQPFNQETRKYLTNLDKQQLSDTWDYQNQSLAVTNAASSNTSYLPYIVIGIIAILLLKK